MYFNRKLYYYFRQKLIFGQYFRNKSRCTAATLVKQADSSVYRGCFGMILRASQQSARAYTQMGTFCATRWSCRRGMLDMLKLPAKKMGAGLLWRHRQTCLLFRDRSDEEHGCIFRPTVQLYVLLEFMKTSMVCASVRYLVRLDQNSNTLYGTAKLRLFIVLKCSMTNKLLWFFYILKWRDLISFTYHKGRPR